MSETAPISKSTVDLLLRSRQADYLRYVAERDEVSLSGALAAILDAHVESAAAAQRPERKVRVHFYIDPAHLAVLDMLATTWGLMRSDAARRLLDSARANDPWIGREQVGASLP